MQGVPSQKTRQLQELAQSVFEKDPSPPNKELLVILVLGCLMLFVGTTATYVVYAVTATSMYSSRGPPPPIITDMIRDWPLLSSSFLGVGSSLLFAGILATAITRIPYDVGFKPRTVLARLCVAALASMWLLVASSGFDLSVPLSLEWIHLVATLVFMVSAVWALGTARGICYFFIQVIQLRQAQQMQRQRTKQGYDTMMTPRTLQGQNFYLIQRSSAPLSTQYDDDDYSPGLLSRSSEVESRLSGCDAACSVCVWTSAIAVTGAAVCEGIAAFLTEDNSAKGYLRQGLAVGELLLLLSAGIAFPLIIYMYTQIEASASEVVFGSNSEKKTYG